MNMGCYWRLCLTSSASAAPFLSVTTPPGRTRLRSPSLDNAIKFTPDGGHIRVLLRSQSAGPRSAGLPLAGPEVIVEDDGPGIPADKREVVLGRRVRLDEARNVPGSGLGLSLVAAVTKLHGARLTLDDAAPGLRVSLRF
jgi:signal transduction histidine kinase